jgi:hypothetical protein
LFLSCVIGRDRERHELLQGHTIFGIDLVQLWRHRRQPQPLLHDCRCYEMPGGNVFLGQPAVTQGLKGSELVEGMQRLGYASTVLLAVWR